MSLYIDIIGEDGTVSSQQVEKVPQVRETVRAVPADSATHLMIKEEDWAWEQLRDYVMRQVEVYHGAQLRNPMKENAIFKSFASRWGANASRIARYAFEIQRGVWKSAPITAGRFAKGSDPFFAVPIMEQLER